MAIEPGLGQMCFHVSLLTAAARIGNTNSRNDRRTGNRDSVSTTTSTLTMGGGAESMSGEQV